MNLHQAVHLIIIRFIYVEMISGTRNHDFHCNGLVISIDRTNDIFYSGLFSQGVDVGPWHGFWGRFMRSDTPVPEGFNYFDFVPYNNGKAGPPFCSQFAYATFSGDMNAMHSCEGYDSDAMYDVTRNIMLGQGVQIPYPDKYWTRKYFLKDATKTALLICLARSCRGYEVHCA
jgi:hypothetical protein